MANANTGDAFPPVHTIVVIGGGQAAGWALKTLRKEGFSGRLIMIADEVHPPYERPPLSKAILSGDALPESVHLVRPEEFAALDVETWQPERATSIDRERRIVRTSGSREVQYDRLIIATGGTARKIPDDVVRTSSIAYLRTLDDALILSTRLRSSRRILVIGGGWIGLEVAATARKLGCEVTLIEGAPRLCARSVPPCVSDFLAQIHREEGVDIRLDCALTSLTDDPESEEGIVATFSDGSVLKADFAIAGIGLNPSTDLAESAGLSVDNGVVVSAIGATDDPAVFACGDVANHPNAWLKRRIRLESWANAQNQAIATARAALGLESSYEEIPWFWSDQYGVNLQILGDVSPHANLIVRGNIDARRATLFFLDGSTLRGVVAINSARDLKLARKWMNQHKSVTAAELQDESRPLA
ncbi:FAD-dependent oxidoreductase [Paraburkholderia terrae]|uniref:NAD(P)/FAD-dependent oxidoreductase n=1 Tax=Paraburkholderia TaxID=1822464 RepID=UPI001EE3986A|nr:FAD-dependent oxidoreductase [Paraburkholderia terrae]BEU21172.1 FAD-dependent oxidoreductase [Paraburkholderia sp. 22B1P]